MNYLTTDELVQLVNQQKHQRYEHAQQIALMSFQKTNSHNKFHVNSKFIFWVLIALIMAHLFYVGIRVVTPNKGINAFNQTRVLAVPMDQDLTEILNVRVVNVQKIDIDRLEIGEKVIIYGKYDTEYYWVEEVLSIDLISNTLSTTFDGFIANQTSLDDVHGIYLGQSNFIGVMNYISSTPRGFVLVIVLDAILAFIAYYVLIRPKRKNISV